jgi:pilus assembly protein CpaE
MKSVRVMIADRDEKNRQDLLNLLEADRDIDVIGEAGKASEVLELIPTLNPEILIMDLRLEDSEALPVAADINARYPWIQVILLSEQEDYTLLKRAMQAGVRELMLKPWRASELISRVKELAELYRRTLKKPGNAGILNQDSPSINKQQQAAKASRVITIFGNKGGIGKSVIAANLAVAAATRYKNQVSLLDLDLQFGDISLMMNINPRKTIAELMLESGELTADLLEEYFYERSGVKVLSAPPKPELAELVNPYGVEALLKVCRQMFTYVFIDTPTFLDETTLTALERSDLILLLISLDIPTIKNIKKGIDILEPMNLLPRTRLILNRSSALSVGLEAKDVEQVLGMKIAAGIPNDFKISVSAINRGISFVDMNPKAAISKSMLELFQLIEKERND